MDEGKRNLIGLLMAGALVVVCLFNGANKDKDEPEKINYAALSKTQIEQRTGHLITDFHNMKFSETERANGNVDTEGVIEFNSQDTEHRFWATFKNQKMVRLKIDSQIVFDETK
ncbi:MAG: hypothetical protein J5965_20925 [Aeriscardovia sp.]|nr:hypothetical protein [Aeriscardovia sp.]